MDKIHNKGLIIKINRIMDTFTKDQIIEYLKGKNNVKDAISDISELGKNLPYVFDTDTDRILFHFDKSMINTGNKLKQKIYEFMCSEGWEKSGLCRSMTYKEVLEYFKLKVKIKKA